MSSGYATAPTRRHYCFSLMYNREGAYFLLAKQEQNPFQFINFCVYSRNVSFFKGGCLTPFKSAGK